MFRLSLVTVLLILLAGSPAAAMRFLGGLEVVVGPEEAYRDDLYLLGRQVEHRGRVEGDLVLIAENFSLTGPVDGDLSAVALRSLVEGPVGDDLKLVSAYATVSGPIAGDAVLVGLEVGVGSEAEIDGDLVVIASKVSFAGRVRGRLIVRCDNLELLGSVGRSADIMVLNSVAIGHGAAVAGDLRYRAPERLDDTVARVVSGKVEYRPVEGIQFRLVRVWERVRPWARLWSFLVALITGWVVLALFHGPLHRLSRELTERFGWCWLVGLGIVPAAAVLVLVLLVLIFTIPLALMLAAVFLVGVYLSRVLFGLWLGRLVTLRFEMDRGAVDYLLYPLGLLLVYLLSLIPLVEWAVRLTVVCSALGAAAIYLYGRRD